jgi:2-dehydro-3-deoxygalactonokinase
MVTVSLIGVDWGTTNLRAWLMDAEGSVLAEALSAEGLLNVVDGDFQGALHRAFGNWRERWPDAPVLLCGMVGSRQGWAEARYLGGAVSLADLAAATTPVPGARIVPGIISQSWWCEPDVMRGEETQIAGALARGVDPDAILCLPGTHSKWVELRDGRIAASSTFLTGELYQRLCDRSVLAGLIAAEGTPPVAVAEGAFAEGLALAPRGPLHHLMFTLRARSLTGAGSGATAAQLSGLLIGTEVSAVGPRLSGRSVVVLGGEAPAERYRTALAVAGIGAAVMDADICCREGLLRVAACVPEWRVMA